jgi:hypothetical protein
LQGKFFFSLFVYSFGYALTRGHVLVNGKQSFFLGAFHGRQQHALGMGSLERPAMESRNSPIVRI